MVYSKLYTVNCKLKKVRFWRTFLFIFPVPGIWYQAPDD